MSLEPHALVSFPPSSRQRPAVLFLMILGHIYREILLRPLIGLLTGLATVGYAGLVLLGGGTLSPGLQMALWLLLLFPLVITLEEFFHAAACLGRGKGDRLHGLLLGRYLVWGRPVSFLFAAVDIRGRLNIIDKLYISAAGPLTTVLTITAAWAGLRLIDAGPLQTALVILVVVPLVGLIPNSRIIQSDGFSIREASRRLNLPRRFMPLELLRAVTFSLRWLLLPWRVPPDDFVESKAAYEQIEDRMAHGDTAGAVDWYRRLVRIDPYNPLVRNNLAWLLTDLGRYQEATRHAQMALRLSPDDPEVKDTLERLRLSQESRAVAG